MFKYYKMAIHACQIDIFFETTYQIDVKQFNRSNICEWIGYTCISNCRV